jgi:type I restriction enzyme S subunit
MSNKVPQIRFNGYSDDWEERKLENIFNIIDGDRGSNYPHNSDFLENGTNVFLDTGNVRPSGFLFNTIKYISDEKDSQLRAGKMEPNDIVMTSRGTLGNIAWYTGDIVDRYPSVRINSAMLILRNVIPNEVSTPFMISILRGNLIDTFMRRMKVGSAQPHITKKDFSKTEVSIPSNFKEQESLGMFFETLDNLIAANQRKLDLLKEQKKGYLQKMFPKNGAKVPELRFAGFADDWEERKLGEEAQLTMGQSPNSENYTKNPDDYILVQGNADMKNGRVVPRVWTTQITKKAEKSDLILSVRAPVGDIGKTDYDVVLGRGVAAIKGNEFIFQQLGKMKLTGYWTRYSTGSTFESINSNDIKDAKIMVPVEEEQQKIGSFFQQLDHLIALHQRKLDLLKEQKKGFLQNMFV